MSREVEAAKAMRMARPRQGLAESALAAADAWDAAHGTHRIRFDDAAIGHVIDALRGHLELTTAESETIANAVLDAIRAAA